MLTHRLTCPCGQQVNRGRMVAGHLADLAPQTPIDVTVYLQHLATCSRILPGVAQWARRKLDPLST
jgi:hypothetical protein